jgi:hypothetical protein
MSKKISEQSDNMNQLILREIIDNVYIECFSAELELYKYVPL